jgi:predicted O-methyltransferase YrrM
MMLTQISAILQTRIEGVLAVPNPTLKAIVDQQTVLDENDQPQRLTSHISVAHANALYQIVRTLRPSLVVEVGMAFGISSLAITTALAEINEGGRLISIDPFQMSDYKGLGVLNIKRAALASFHELITKPDYLALPELVEQPIQFDLAYIDGMHTFDYTLLDFFYIDKLLKVGGIVGFNDCALPAVRRVLGFVLSHRKYVEFDAGLRPNYFTRNPFTTAKRIITRTSKADRYYRKLEAWEPAWDYYRSF